MNQPSIIDKNESDLPKKKYQKIIFIIAGLFCLTPFVSPPVALLMGLIIALFIGHPYLRFNNRATQILLKISVVGLGFGMNVHSALKAGKAGILFTVVSIIGTLFFWLYFWQNFKNRKENFLLNFYRHCNMWWKCNSCYFSGN